MTTIRDYAGRTVDLAMYAGPPVTGVGGPVDPTLAAGGAGLVVTGRQKFLQRVALILLTPRGSKRYDPGFGTTFLTDALPGGWRTPADVRTSYATARLDLVRQLRAAERATDPPDERVDEVVLAGVGVSAGEVTVTFTLSTLAGPDVPFVLPIPVSVGR